MGDNKKEIEVKEDIKGIENEPIEDFRVWKQRRNIYSDEIISKIKYSKRNIKEAVNQLVEEEKDHVYKFRRYKEKAKKEFKYDLGNRTIDEVSQKSKKILMKIGKHIQEMKKSTADITKLNGLYLEEKTNSNKTERNFHKITPYKFEKEQNTEEEYLKELNRKNNLVQNFIYVNENYRKQLNGAFLKYNPVSHLENLKILLQADQNIRKDIVKVKKEVEDDIQFACDKHRFKKRYLNYIKKHKRTQSEEYMNKTQDNLNKNNIASLPKLKQSKSKAALISNKPLTFIEKIKKKEMEKLLLKKEQSLEEMGKMKENTNAMLKTYLNQEVINDKIKKYISDYANYYYNESYLGKKEYSHLIPKKDEYFNEEKLSINKMLGEMYSAKLQKKAAIKEKSFTDKIIKDNNNFISKLENSKNETLKEFNNKMDKNNIIF